MKYNLHRSTWIPHDESFARDSLWSIKYESISCLWWNVNIRTQIYIYISRHQKYSSHLTRTPNPSTRRARRASSFDAQKLRQYHVIWYRREHTQISAICSHTKWTHVKNLHVELQHLYKAVLNIPWTVCASRWWCRVTCLFHGNRSGLGLMVFGWQTHEIFVA